MSASDLMLPEGDDAEGVNPYQPHVFRVVMLVRL